MPLEGIPIRASPGSHRRAGHDRVEVDQPDAEADQVEAPRRGVAADQVRQHRQLAARDLDLRLLGALLQPDPDLLEHLGVGLLDGDVVEQRDRVGADADDVVGVHPDQVDADRVEAAHLLADDHLRSHAVRRQGEPADVVQPQHVRVVARAERRAAGAPGGDRGEHVDERPHRGAGAGLVHARARVGGVGHAPIQAEWGAGGERRTGAQRRRNASATASSASPPLHATTSSCTLIASLSGESSAARLETSCASRSVP